MRPIKFRQLITKEDGSTEWHFWGYLYTDIFGLPVFTGPLGAVEWDKRPRFQFTGLHDKNGVEIYCGSLLQNESGRICEVFWQNGCWDTKPVKNIRNTNAAGFWPPDWKRYIEVVGDIHTTPELLGDVT